MVTLTVNGESRQYDGEGDMPLLWYLRDVLVLTGTKYGCGKGLCGSCTVHFNGQAIRSCSVSMDRVDGAEITTIEAIDTKAAKAVQTAWEKLDVVQCGYCQSGQVMAAAALPDDLRRQAGNGAGDEVGGQRAGGRGG